MRSITVFAYRLNSISFLAKQTIDLSTSFEHYQIILFKEKRNDCDNAKIANRKPNRGRPPTKTTIIGSNIKYESITKTTFPLNR